MTWSSPVLPPPRRQHLADVGLSKVKLGVTPDINAIATIIISVVAVGVLAAALLMMAQERRRTKDMQLAARG